MKIKEEATIKLKEAYYGLASEHYSRNQWQSAIEWFTKLVSLDADYGDAVAKSENAKKQIELESLYAKGMDYFRSGAWEKATGQFREVVRLDANYRDSAARLQEAQARTGILLNKYRILERLGSGALGDVYLAEDMELKRKVAIKHLRPAYAADEYALKCFREEARTIASLRHPSIAIVHGLEQEDGQSYIIMEYAEEGTLADFLNTEGPLPIIQAIDLTITLCRALAAVHRQRIFHRDIKPSNILLIKSEDIIAPKIVPKLSDFGLSSSATEDLSRGTIQYTSPEQLYGESLDARSNIYSLGIVLYEMLTGDPLFAGNADEIIRAQLEQKPPSLRSVRKEILPSLEKVVLKALSKKPEDRYQTAEEMAEDLQRASEAELEKEEQVRNLYAQADQYIHVQDWPMAVETLKAISSLNPNYEDAAHLLAAAQKQMTLETTYEEGLTALGQGDWDKARESFGKIVDIDSDFRDAAGKLKEAEKHKHLLSLYTEASRLEKMEKWSEAAKEYIQIMNIEPSYRDAAQRLAMVHERYRSFGDGADRLEAGKEKHLLLLYNEASRLEQMEKWSEAIQQYIQIISIAPDYRDATQRLAIAGQRDQLRLLYEEARVLFAEKNWQGAAKKLQEVLDIDPYYQDAAPMAEAADRHAQSQMLYSEGMEHLENRDFDRAIATFKKIQRSDPDYENVDVRLAEAERQKGWQDLYDKGMACFGRKDWRGATEKFMQLLSENPEHPTAVMLLEEAKWRQAYETGGNPIKAWWSSQNRAVKVMWIWAAATFVFALCNLLSGNPAPDMLRYMLAMNATPTTMISPTATSMSVPSFTPASTPTSTFTPFPPPTSTPYPAPVLVSPPEEGPSFAKGQDVKLQWEWGRDLAEDEFFEVRIRLKGKQKFDLIGRIKIPYQLVLASGLAQAGTYEWQVAIVSPSGEERGVSQIWSFEVR